MRRLGSYLARHGSGYKFQMAVPEDLRPIVGRRMWRRYLPGMAADEARLTALQLALEHKKEIERLRAAILDASDWSPAWQGLQTSALVMDVSSRKRRTTRVAPAFTLQSLRPAGGFDLSMLLAATASNDNGGSQASRMPVELGPWGHVKPDTPIAIPTSAGRVAADAAIPPAAMMAPWQPSPPESQEALTDLVDLWREIARPRAQRSVLRMMTCATMLADLIGPIPVVRITREHIMAFRDHLETTDLSRATARLYLQGIHRLFSVALSEGRVNANPASGVLLRAGTDKFVDRDRRRPFNSDEITAIFAALSREPLAFQWIVKLLAFHGMRSGEAVQLHVDDVVALFGVPVLRIHDRHGSIKNRFSQRDVPLHPACSPFMDYARARGSGRIFAESEWRADRFQRYAGVFLRRNAGITDATVTMHSLRHTWRTMARELAMPPPVSRAIMGHSMGSDVHEGYGSGPSLRLTAEWMARIDPTSMDAGGR